MRQLILAALLVLILAACNLNDPEPPSATPQIVTATLSITLPPTSTPTREPTETPEPSATPDIPTATPTPEDTATPEPTATLPPTATATLSPTRVVVAPPTVIPLDDGSGNQITGTGLNTAASSTITLPETLYYLSDQSGSMQVWRLRYGMPVPEQMSHSTDSITAFDVATDGTLAYITVRGEMVIGGMPYLPPSGERVSALAWSPFGDWLAFTTQDGTSNGLWLRNRENRVFELQSNSETRTFTGPIEWKPDGTEVLIRLTENGQPAYCRVNITSNELILLPNDTPFQTAHWSINGTAIITSGAEQVQSIDANSVAQTLISLSAWHDDAQQFNNGTVTFVAGGGESGPLRLYRLDPGSTTPIAVTQDLTQTGAVDFLWDNVGQQVLLVVYDPAESALGMPTLRTQDGTMQDLGSLLGLIGSPQWGPIIALGDSARIQTTQGESLNVRDAPSTGSVLAMLPNGTRVIVRGGPRLVDGAWWWQIQTSDGITGWATQSVAGADGYPLRTLLPAN